MFDFLCQSKIVKPTFITDYPQETTSLCKPHRNKQGLIERFELFICGMELANAYTELNDPVLQYQYFKEERERNIGDAGQNHPIDIDFVEALTHGMPPTGGLGIGIDRLMMLVTGKESIKEVILYPMLKKNQHNLITSTKSEAIRGVHL